MSDVNDKHNLTYFECIGQINSNKGKGLKNSKGETDYDKTIKKYFNYIGIDKHFERVFEFKGENQYEK